MIERDLSTLFQEKREGGMEDWKDGRMEGWKDGRMDLIRAMMVAINLEGCSPLQPRYLKGNFLDRHPGSAPVRSGARF